MGNKSTTRVIKYGSLLKESYTKDLEILLHKLVDREVSIILIKLQSQMVDLVKRKYKRQRDKAEIIRQFLDDIGLTLAADLLDEWLDEENHQKPSLMVVEGNYNEIHDNNKVNYGG